MSEIDLVRQLVELAVTSGRSHQSPQTSFVHYCHESLDEEVNHTIPVYENLLFALSLIRMQTVDNIMEGKALIKKILQFQNKETGNFPRYLHQYPECRDSVQWVHLAPPLYWVLKGFQKVLGEELIEMINSAVRLSLEKCCLTENFEKAPFQIAVKMAAVKMAFGKLWKDTDIQQQGEAWLDELQKASEADDFGTWYSPVYIAETLIALQMVYDKISESPWKKFWTWLSETWYQPARCFFGPPIQVLQWRSEPQPTLYDLYLGDFAGGYPYHSFIDHPFQLQGALVRSLEDSWEPLALPFKRQGEVAGHPWLLHQTEIYGASMIETRGPLPSEMRKGFHHFRMVWGDLNRIHSFSCQGGHFTSMRFEDVQGGYDLFFELAENLDRLEKIKGQELCFAIDQHESLEILVNGKKATTFNFQDVVEFKSDQIHFSLKCFFLEGDARIMGHIHPGNRMGQVDLKGAHRFNAYDWEIFLRTVRRYTSCKVKVELRLLS